MALPNTVMSRLKVALEETRTPVLQNVPDRPAIVELNGERPGSMVGHV
jgi:hypothetical protein